MVEEPIGVRQDAVEYFFYCRDIPGTGALLDELAEAHWSYMDAYADAMIARGPTVAADGVTHTGSMHMVDLPDPEAARAFAFDEPYYKAGVYGEVLIRRWRSELGRTMWDFEDSGTRDDARFLIIGHGRPGPASTDAVLDDHRRYLVNKGYAEQLIEYGPLSSDDGMEWLGSVMLIELPDQGAVDAMLQDEPFVLAGLYASVEIHHWRFGGRP